MRYPGLAGVAVIAAGLASGCSSSCGATAEKLAALQRGITYQQSAAIMGCAGAPVAAEDAAFSRFEWHGPSSLFTATELDFHDDRLLYYTTRSRSGF
jgi:hypothetical protein